MKRAAAAVLLLAACGGKTAAPPPPPPDPFADDPIAVFATLEERLLTARRVEIEAKVQSIGLVSSDLTGTVRIERDRLATIEVAGGFSGVNADARWTSEAPIDPLQNDVPPWTWADAILLGFTRMGALHNWAKVIGGADPDDGNGDIRTWVAVDQLAWKGETPETRTLTYKIVVEDQPAGEAELTLDERGLPVKRDVLVHFNEGDMRVVETYTRFELAK